MRVPWKSLAAAVVVTAGLVVGGVATLDGDEPTPRPAAVSPTPLAGLDTTTLTVPRADFCADVERADVERALGGEVADAQTWGNGDAARLTATLEDVSHEHGCSWASADGTLARAWVFAPPVSAARAAELVTDAGSRAGCAPVEAAAFGSPGVATTCSAEAATTAAHQGLFGDAWLTCTLEQPGAVADPALAERADLWCAALAQAAAAG